ncbi:hypothetical protein DPMN_146821 [Dreissena polymorpha]|uniref:Uncharacterized protein n=1 Tax=Dreissena polymorpha TaxID=45954 RepID=A0A9D4F6J4_DREPO|nr:hypothetical protein DPMN_146821 [Dreissena polymorpha]
MNLLTKFHDNRTLNVASREKMPRPWKQCFQANIIIFKLIPDTIETNLLTKFHEDWTINGLLESTKTIFELIQDIIGTNLQTKFYDDRKIIVTSRVLTRKNAPTPGSHVFNQPASFKTCPRYYRDESSDQVFMIIGHKMWPPRMKNAPALGSNTNLLSKFHEIGQ